MAADLFGIERENRIRKSGIRDVFTPHHPVQELELLFGRGGEVKAMLEAINTPGLHAAVYGQRGVGKSSLANVAAKFLFKHLKNTYVKRCTKDDSFESIMRDALRQLGFTPHPTSTTQKSENSDGGKIDLAIYKHEGSGKNSQEATWDFESQPFDPGAVADYLKDKSGLLLIDEADALPPNGPRAAIAQMIKHLSDARSPFKVLVVGISDTCADLFEAHPSVARCIKEIKLDTMAKDALREIIAEGAKRANLFYPTDVIERIVSVSHGYPFYTHLLALRSGEEAIGEGRDGVSSGDLKAACGKVTHEADQSLKATYDRSTFALNTDSYVEVARSAVELNTPTFTTKQLREMFEQRTLREVPPQQMNGWLSKVTADDGSKIFRRLDVGVYCWSDPRLPIYVSLLTESQ